MSYSSKRLFKIWAYSVSHSFLLLRSTAEDIIEGNYECEENFNIDVEFNGVGYLDLPVILENIAIREIKKNVPDKFIMFKPSLGFKVFEIVTNDNIFYVVAGNYQVGKNNWLNENRIYDPMLEYDEILASS